MYESVGLYTPVSAHAINRCSAYVLWGAVPAWNQFTRFVSLAWIPACLSRKYDARGNWLPLLTTNGHKLSSQPDNSWTTRHAVARYLFLGQKQHVAVAQQQRQSLRASFRDVVSQRLTLQCAPNTLKTRSKHPSGITAVSLSHARAVHWTSLRSNDFYVSDCVCTNGERDGF